MSIKNNYLEESFGYEAPFCALSSLDEDAVLCASGDADATSGEFDEVNW